MHPIMSELHARAHRDQLLRDAAEPRRGGPVPRPAGTRRGRLRRWLARAGRRRATPASVDAEPAGDGRGRGDGVIDVGALDVELVERQVGAGDPVDVEVDERQVVDPVDAEVVERQVGAGDPVDAEVVERQVGAGDPVDAAVRVGCR